jgi:uncharacterized protein (TIGR00725 family)
VTARAAVAVVGPGDTDDVELLAGAEQIGAALAAAGAVVVTGGLGGVMAAASRGASSAGGLVVGILPGGDAADANPWVEVALPSAMGEGRNALVARSAAVVVAVGGSWGTLSEVAMARRAGTPVVSWRGWHVADADDPGLMHVSSPADAVSTALAALPSR